MLRKKRKIRAGTSAGYRAGLWGQKIRSRGKGRGLGRGRGRGPIEVPVFPRPPIRRPRLPIPMPRPPIRRPGREMPFLRLERKAKEKVKRFIRKRLKKIPKSIPKIEEYDREIPRRKLFQVEFPIARPKRKRIPPRLI